MHMLSLMATGDRKRQHAPFRRLTRASGALRVLAIDGEKRLHVSIARIDLSSSAARTHPAGTLARGDVLSQFRNRQRA
jgi:hypothetical protein